MGFDDDILQDFLLEAAEILEQLQEQLVELESRPDDGDLLNAIFRGFHTVKGGAGFLNLESMVELCHVAENLFDLLRNDQLRVSADLMDVVLQALDQVNAMFGELQQGEALTPAPKSLLDALQAWCEPGAAATPEPVPATPVPVPVPAPTAATGVAATSGQGIESLTQPEYGAMLATLDVATSGSGVGDSDSGDSDSGDITDDEFEALLDQLHGEGRFSAEPAASAPENTTPVTPEGATSGDDEISDGEFEALLDQLHGKGQFSAAITEPATVAAPAAKAPEAESDLIDDDEFEQLLDQLHGKGKGPAAATGSESPALKASQPKAANKAAAAPAETSVRVDTRRLDDIMNLVGELVLVRNRLLTLGQEVAHEQLGKALASLDVVTADLQGGVMKTRMQPIKKVFGRFPRVVRDLARNLNKDVQLTLQGEDTDLDKNLVEALADPLVHLVRNAVDHGIEMPDEREAAGKARQGNILLSAEQQGEHILLTIRDDGAGMDAERLKGIAISRGILEPDAAARMPDADAYALIFAPGFSTKTEISDISGRGVGMDVVKTRIAELNGTVSIDSQLGQGTTLSIKVPLTLAIMPTLMVEIVSQVFALPLACVSEIFHVDLTKTNLVDGQLTITVRERAIPLFYLDTWLTKSEGRPQREGMGHVVLVHNGTQMVGFVVDRLLGQEEVVIKPLGETLQGTPGIAGATITSNGGIALILDVPGMLKHYARRG